MAKYQHLTDYQIDEKIKNGEFREEGILIRNVSNGENVKVKSLNTSNECTFPATFIQVNNSYIYQTDFKPIFEAILNSRNNQNFSELEEIYNILLDYADSFVTYGAHLPELLNQSIKAAAIFENKIRKYVEELKLQNIESIDITPFIGALNAYIYVLFIDIISTFSTHKQKFKNDNVIIGKILNIRSILKNIYEQLLVESTYDRREKCVRLDMSGSIYALYLLDTKYDIYQLDDIVKHDSRFKSSLDVINFFKRFNLDSEIGESDRPKIQAYKPSVKMNSNRIRLVNILRIILSDLDNLENLRMEILNIEDSQDIIELIESGIHS